MESERRRAIVAAYRERKSKAGIYALTCRPLNQRWVGHAPDLATIQNRLWFTLRQGAHPRPSLQAAWTAHGAETFALEVLETFDEEALGFVRDRMTRDRLAHWRAKLGAEPV